MECMQPRRLHCRWWCSVAGCIWTTGGSLKCRLRYQEVALDDLDTCTSREKDLGLGPKIPDPRGGRHWDRIELWNSPFQILRSWDCHGVVCTNLALTNETDVESNYSRRVLLLNIIRRWY